MTKIAFIVPALPPQLNGIGDYSAVLAGELVKSHQVSVWTARNTPFDPIPEVAIEPVFRVGRARSFHSLVEQAQRENPDWVVLQYQCFSYGKWGLNLELPRAMRRLSRGGTRFALMMHEPWVRVTGLKKAVMILWQRWQLWSLGRSARANFFSIEVWRDRFAPWFPGRPNVHLPVMSNIPYLPLSVSRATTQRELGLKTGDFALGFFGTLHETRLLARVEDAARAVSAAGLNPVVLYIGPHGKAMRAALPNRQILDQGALAAREISRRFAVMDLYLATFSDGVSTRRGSLMAALQHGTAVVGTSGHLTDSLWQSENGRSIALAPANDALAFAQLVEKLVGDADKRRAMAKAARELYQREFAVEVTASRLMATLDSL